MIERPPLDKNIGLLQEIEALSRALSLPTSSNHKPKATPSSSLPKKASFWNWKPLKALSHIRQRRFDCVFSLHVHCIENLPTALGDAALSVHWKRTSDSPSSAVGTSSVHSFDGIAEFEETLTYRCSVYGSRKSSSHSAAKYEPRHFLIYVLLSDAPEVDLGKQMIDVTRLLPLTLDDLEKPENRSGKWSTSFRLSGRGKGASLNVSLGFLLIDERTVVDSLNLYLHDDGSVGKVSNKGRRRARSLSVEDVRVLHEILPSSKSNASFLADAVEKLDIGNCEVREMCDSKVGTMPESDDLPEENEAIKSKLLALSDHAEGHYLKEPDFPIADEGIENSSTDQIFTPNFEKIDVEGFSQGSSVVTKKVEGSFDDDCDYKESIMLPDYNQLARKVQDSLSSNFLSLNETEVLDAQCTEPLTPISESVEHNSLTFDDSTEAIASEFLGMLGIDHSPSGLSSESDVESPRERLWKQFEEETFSAGSFPFGLDIQTELDDEPWKDEHNPSDDSEDFDLLLMVHEAERELLEATQAPTHYLRAELLVDAETEALMRKWGLNENAFRCAPPRDGGIDGTEDSPLEEPLNLPPLGEGLGPFVQTKDGGFLRSMSPALFANSKNSAPLIMQVSSPIVIPAQMGSSVMEILHCLASVGIEKLSAQAKKLMPLEEVKGKTMQQIAWEATSPLDACKREGDIVISQKTFGRRKKEGILHLTSSSASHGDSDFVSIDHLAPLAMDKIESLSMEGLRIQSGMSDEESPSNISPDLLENACAIDGRESDNGNLQGHEGTAGLQLLNVDGNLDDVDGLMSLSITLDEWMRLDSGVVLDDDQNSDRTSKILAAHHAAASNLITGGWNQNKAVGKKRSDGKWGLLGSNFTVALMVQLRDPLRNYDPVGTPMLALVQVERVFVHPKPKLYAIVYEKIDDEEDNELESETEINSEPILVNEENEEEKAIPQFKITEVYVAGIKTEANKKSLWSNPMQQQSGSRWLIANGMGNRSKHPFLKSKPARQGDALWSISSSVHGAGSKWKEILAMDSLVRSPDVKFRNEMMRLR